MFLKRRGAEMCTFGVLGPPPFRAPQFPGLGPPTLWGPTLRGPAFRSSHPSPHSSGAGDPPRHLLPPPETPPPPSPQERLVRVGKRGVEWSKGRGGEGASRGFERTFEGGGGFEADLRRLQLTFLKRSQTLLARSCHPGPFRGHHLDHPKCHEHLQT